MDYLAEEKKISKDHLFVWRIIKNRHYQWTAINKQGYKVISTTLYLDGDVLFEIFDSEIENQNDRFKQLYIFHETLIKKQVKKLKYARTRLSFIFSLPLIVYSFLHAAHILFSENLMLSTQSLKVLLTNNQIALPLISALVCFTGKKFIFRMVIKVVNRFSPL